MSWLKQFWWRGIFGSCVLHPAWMDFWSTYPAKRVMEHFLAFLKMMAFYFFGSLLYIGFQAYSHHLSEVWAWGFVLFFIAFVFLLMIRMTRQGIKKVWNTYLNEYPEKVNQLVMEHTLPRANVSLKTKRL